MFISVIVSPECLHLFVYFWYVVEAHGGARTEPTRMKKNKRNRRKRGTNSSDEGQNRGRLGDMRDVGKNEG